MYTKPQNDMWLKYKAQSRLSSEPVWKHTEKHLNSSVDEVGNFLVWPESKKFQQTVDLNKTINQIVLLSKVVTLNLS